jgi:hypothetical protein
MDLMAYWKWENYVRDRRTRQDFAFNSDQRRLHDAVDIGDDVWLVCGRSTGAGMHYFLVGRLRVAEKTTNHEKDPDARYGHFRVVGDPARSAYYEPGENELTDELLALSFCPEKPLGSRNGIAQKLQTLRNLSYEDSLGLTLWEAMLRLDPLTYQVRASQPTAEGDEFEHRVNLLLSSPEPLPRPRGRVVPTRSMSERAVFARDPLVKAWVLQQARDCCERCHQPSPFTLPSGEPYLEVHHVQPLAEGGPDTVENAVALCPNCHRHLHLGDDAVTQTAAMYALVDRLVRPLLRGTA